MSPPRKTKAVPKKATRSRTPRKNKSQRRSTTKKGRRKAVAGEAKTVWLHAAGILTVVFGFLSLLSLRLANAPALDAVVLGYFELLIGVVIVWLIFAFASRGTNNHSELLMLLLLPTVFLVSFGILIQHRVKGIDIFAPNISDFAYPVGIVLLLAVLFACRNGRFRLLRIPGELYAVVSIIGMIALLLLGSRYRGAVYAAGRMTPTELLKPVMAIYLSAFLANHTSVTHNKGSRTKSTTRRRHGFPWLRWVWSALSWVILMGLLAYQRDLGMMVILNGMLFFTLFAATSAYWLLPVGVLGAAIGGFVAVRLLPHVQQRVAIWLDPFSETTGSGWQLLQSLAALYNGGLLGAGFGEGSPQTIPVASSDFIYASIGEELGLVGCFLLLVIIVILLGAGFRIAASCKDRFGSLLATSLTSVLALQTILNLGGVTKALPMTGVPLPFLSHGGTNLVVSFVSVGLLAAIAASDSSRKRAKQ